MPCLETTKHCAIALAALAATWTASANSSADSSEFYETSIRPLLVEHCYECHSEEAGEQKGGLLLDRQMGWLDGGDTGKAVIPGNLEGSLLITAIHRTDEDLEMPPKYSLADDEIRVLEEWIRRGAPGPKDDMGDTEFSQLGDQDLYFKRAKTHWAFQPIKQVDPPRASTAAWNQHPIDQFIFAKLAEKKITPSPPAPPSTLRRRLSYDLTGLPASMDEVANFKNVESTVDKLLESPRFGEHFARLWLDVARYADTADTYRADTKTPHYYPFAFTYRDYVIASFNEDKPYDQFIREQLAADLMDLPEDAPELAALGFLGLSPKRTTGDDYVDDAIDVTSRGFLGLTAACARCHDHKYEAIPTADYYSLHGIFDSLSRPGIASFDNYPVLANYHPDEKAKADYENARAAIEEKIVAAGNKKRGGNNRSVAQEIRETDLAELLLTHDGAPARAMVVLEKKEPVETGIYLRGDSRSRGDKVPRRFLKVLDPKQEPFNPDNSGRLDLANKIAAPDNPLTARVFVNRVWGALMGSHIVETPSDFGFQGSAPSHPELLDWLSQDFIAHGWSLKHLVRTIVTSRTYQQRSATRPELAETDPANRLLARANVKRLSIEEVRDSLLSISGNLDTRMRGRSGQLWGEDYTPRRSIYGYINRFNLDPTLRNFDFPSPVTTQEKRPESIVPPQALFTMNSPFVVEQSQALIAELNFVEGVDREQRITAIFEAIVQRPPDEMDLERIGRFVDIEKGRKQDAWPLVAQALFMSNEFLYVD